MIYGLLSTFAVTVQKTNIHLLLLLALAAFSLLLQLRNMGFVYEDAAILMRYAEHVAAGYGMVWNIGEPPADGATDFLFVLVVALFRFLGFSIEWAARLPIIIAHLLSAGLIFWGNKRLGAGSTESALAAVLLIAGPATGYIAAGFGAPFFGLWVVVLTLGLLRVSSFNLRSFLQQGSKIKDQGSRFIGIFALLMGLTRPEGVLLAVIMVGAACAGMERKRALSLMKSTAFWLFGIGGLYFLWRWWYFGHPFPTPFLKKGGFSLHIGGLKSSVYFSALMLGPLAMLWLFAGKRNWKLIRWLLISTGGFILLWVLISSEMNYLGRFQYPVFCIALAVLPLLVSLKEKPLWQKGLFYLLPITFYLFTFQADYRQRDGRYEVAQLLAAYKTEDATLVTTEAGLLPLYSGWRSIDAWGLNDPEIARNGIDTSALAKDLPAVIMFQAYFAPGRPKRNETVMGCHGAQAGRLCCGSWLCASRCVGPKAGAYALLLCAS
jgi:arabinofuranosyltransferase